MAIVHRNIDFKERCYRLAFSMIRGVNPVTGGAILQRMHTEADFFNATAVQLQTVMGTKSPLFEREYRDKLLALAENETVYDDINHISELYFTDESYPQLLQQCSDAPLMLYGLGDCDLSRSHIVSIVGTRHATAYGVDFVNKLVSGLAERVGNVVVVSGLAYGIDIASHRAALSAGVPTIGVVAHGLSTLYPSSHRSDAARMVKSGGMVLTEYLHDAPVHKGNFLARNRIVAGMAECLIVVESASKGGALTTARIASEYSRDVFALPGRTSDLYSQGCNKLISTNVAHLITSVDDLIDVMGWEAVATEGQQKSLFPSLSPDENIVVEYLQAKGDARINTISVETGIAMSRLMPLMVNLEFKGVVINFPGGAYRLA